MLIATALFEALAIFAGAWLIVAGLLLWAGAIIPKPSRRNCIPFDYQQFTDHTRRLVESYLGPDRVYVLAGENKSLEACVTGIGPSMHLIFWSDFLRQPKYLDAVIAHEIGHVALNHALRRILFMTTILAGTLAAGYFLLTVLTPAETVLALIVLYVLVNPRRLLEDHKIRTEIEADRFAVQYGYKHAMIEFMTCSLHEHPLGRMTQERLEDLLA